MLARHLHITPREAIWMDEELFPGMSDHMYTMLTRELQEMNKSSGSGGGILT